MKAIYILVVLVIAAAALGCIGNKQTGTSTKAPVSPAVTSVSPTVTTVSPAGTPVPANSEDPFGTNADVTEMDTMLADSGLDTPLSNAI